MDSPPAGTFTFLFTDIEGSTKLWERNAAKMQAALARHDEILKGTVEEHGGHVFKMVGDACYAAFADAFRAFEAALAGQRVLFAEPWDEECRIRVRMALYTGATEERDGDYFGTPLNRVARLLSAGHGGQTLLSLPTRELVQDRLEPASELRDLGEHRLKDLPRPERIFQIVAPSLPSNFPPLKTLDTRSNEDRYRLIEAIGSGGMADVYLAYDEVLERDVAFKILHRKYADDKESIERFRREARSAASLAHTNIVSVHDRGETDEGSYYMVMEYMPGGTLEDLIEQEGPLPPQRAVAIAIQTAQALQVAHEREVIHRDIKPQNILLSNTGEAKVADFGIARVASATTVTQAGAILGTLHYMSPEQALGNPATPQSDLYSLGVVLYQMLTGELPYDAETPVGIVMKHVSGLSRSPRDVNPNVSEAMNAVTMRLLAKDPNERYPDAAALIKDLERVKEGLPPAAATTLGSKRAIGTVRPGSASQLQRKRPGTGADTPPARPGGVTGPGSSRNQIVGVVLAILLVLISVGVIAVVVLTQS